MRVAVTGAGGFVGGHTASYLQDKDWHVVAVIRARRSDTARLLKDMEILECDLVQPFKFSGQLDVLVHCAAEIPARCPDADTLFERNVLATRHVFEAALEAGVTRIIFCSSMSAFGTIMMEEVYPDTEICAPDAYGRSKLASEALLEDVTHSLPELAAISLRLPGVVGAGSHDNFLSGAAANMLSGNPITVRNPFSPFNNILPVSNLFGYIDHLGHTLPSGYRNVTLAASQPAPFIDVINEIQRGAGTNVPIHFGEDQHSFLVSSSAAVELGYQPPDTLAAARHFGQAARENHLCELRQNS